jgi:iron(III) transport system ATP-binding protein
LTVARGEILALLGPSGCGKTTTLRLIAGFERPTSGAIEINSQTVANADKFVPADRRQIGMVFQNYALFPHLNVAENIAYGVKPAERKARVREVLETVELTDLATRMPHELSGGQQQRVTLARALAPRPTVLLLDEPFSGLDAGLRLQVRTEVARILRATGATAIVVTHNQEEAFFLGDRIAVMQAGRIEQVGTPEDVFGAPATRFVAEFLGETDFLPGQVSGSGIETELGFLEQPVELPFGTRVHVAFRSDDVSLIQDHAGPARVVERRFQGTTTLYRVQLASGSIVHSRQQHTVQLEPGTPVRVLAQPGHALAFFEL